MLLLILIILQLLFVNSKGVFPYAVSPILKSSSPERYCSYVRAIHIKSRSLILVTFYCRFDQYALYRIRGQFYSTKNGVYEAVGEMFNIMEDDRLKQWKANPILIDDEGLFVAYMESSISMPVHYVVEVYGGFCKLDFVNYKCVTEKKFLINDVTITTGYVVATRINKRLIAVVYTSRDRLAFRIVDIKTQELISKEDRLREIGSLYPSIDTLYGHDGFIITATYASTTNTNIFKISHDNYKDISYEIANYRNIQVGSVFPEPRCSYALVINKKKDYVVLWRRVKHSYSYQFFSRDGELIGDRQDIVLTTTDAYIGMHRLRENVFIFIYKRSNNFIEGMIIDKKNNVLNSTFLIYKVNSNISGGASPNVIPLSRNTFAVSWGIFDKTNSHAYTQVFKYSLSGYEYVDYYEKYFYDPDEPHPVIIAIIELFKWIEPYLAIIIIVLLVFDMLFLIVINNVFEEEDRYIRFKSKAILNEQFGEIEWEYKKPFRYLIYYFQEPIIFFAMFQRYLIRDKTQLDIFICLFLLCTMMYMVFPFTILIFYMISFIRGISDIPRFSTKDEIDNNCLRILTDVGLGFLLFITLLVSYFCFPFYIIYMLIMGNVYKCCCSNVLDDHITTEKAGSSLIVDTTLNSNHSIN